MSYDSDLLRSATPTAAAGGSPRDRGRDRRSSGGSSGKRRLLLTFIALVVGLGAGMTFFYFPVLAISQVSVVGTQRLSHQDLLDKLALKGNNLLSLPVEEVRAQLMHDAWVRNVTVRRSLPGSVVVTVEERSPAILWQSGKELYLVDRDGTVLETTKIIDATLPLIKDMDNATHSVGDKLNPDATSLALTLTDRLSQDIKEKAKFFEYLSIGGLVVETDKGHRARFGDSTDLQWKLSTWTAVLKTETPSAKVGHIDLRFGDRPFVRP